MIDSDFRNLEVKNSKMLSALQLLELHVFQRIAEIHPTPPPRNVALQLLELLLVPTMYFQQLQP